MKKEEEISVVSFIIRLYSDQRKSSTKIVAWAPSIQGSRISASGPNFTARQRLSEPSLSQIIALVLVK